MELLADAARLDEAPADQGARRKNRDGNCCAVYDNILSSQGWDPIDFSHKVFEALKYGRRKGNAVMIVGCRDTGNTTVTAPADFIFNATQRLPIGLVPPPGKHSRPRADAIA